MGHNARVGAAAGSDRPPLDDSVLVSRAQRGDPRAFEQLLRRHQQMMFSVAVRILGNRDDAEDATQSAFIAAWRQLPEFRSEAKFSTWLYRIVTNRALNVVRSRARSDAQSDLAQLVGQAEPAAGGAGPAGYAETSALLRDLRSALAALPEELRVCWLLREVDNCSYDEAAGILGIPPATARGRIYRARQKLAEAMEAWR